MSNTNTQRKLLVLDFDGVIHSYVSGWKGEEVAKDPPVPGAVSFLLAAVPHFRVAVYGSRSSTLRGRQCMRNYCIDMMHEHFKSMGTDEYSYASSWVYQWLSFPENKGPAFLSIDDRAMTFEGTWPDIQALLDFQPWNKKDTKLVE